MTRIRTHGGAPRSVIWRRLLLAFLWLSLQGCTSIPLATAIRMSTFNESDFARLQADQVGVKLRMPADFGLDVTKSWLAIEVTSQAGVQQNRFELELVALRETRLPGGLFSGAIPGREYELRLADASQIQFRELQAFLARAEADDIDIHVAPKLSHAPKDASSVKIWIDVRLSAEGGYFALVDGAEVSLKDRPTSAPANETNRESQE